MSLPNAASGTTAAPTYQSDSGLREPLPTRVAATANNVHQNQTLSAKTIGQQPIQKETLELTKVQLPSCSGIRTARGTTLSRRHAADLSAETAPSTISTAGASATTPETSVAVDVSEAPVDHFATTRRAGSRHTSLAAVVATNGGQRSDYGQRHTPVQPMSTPELESQPLPGGRQTLGKSNAGACAHGSRAFFFPSNSAWTVMTLFPLFQMAIQQRH
jgi:hypothetical protein